VLRDVCAVLLDMDGTLVDSDAAVERSWRAWAAEYGLDGGAVLGGIHGHPAASTVRRLLPMLDDAEVERAACRQHELQYDDLADVTAATGAEELIYTLEHLRLPWAIVTSADRRLARNRLAVARIEPPLLITVDDVRAVKPAPEGYLLAAGRLAATIGRCLVVEDSIPGLAAGRAAGAITAALRGLPGDLQVDGLRDLARRLAARGRPVPNPRSRSMPSLSADTAHASPPTAVATDRPAAS
jgi:mannitol-1-/sugar-/sorbitol-6-phosphatase